MNQTTQKFFHELSQVFGKLEDFPPPQFVSDLEMSVLEYTSGESIKVTFPIYEKYNNPMGSTFGGYFGMFFDAAFGPFSGLSTKAATTSLDLNVSFIKGLSTADKEVIVKVEVVNQSRSFLIMEAKAYKTDGTLVATATTRMFIIKLK
jgi:uncharacterized protein (TIGR00369 family)